ncbi:GspE/PulE family protein [Peloplasma aerotolerans]|uniref:ATPase, T2SS/T4P/T4SS family n=1 Tax=Peloplasma aerotolerans TaxID=3044389 RepID=A0AAW6U923_9MOLU|nr:ATPase, T2SS/T4P/T4SS family [Mariniplasma sp. M4Ah]MDI6452598.1 ATPase, T2SS/T4P/T4SS family [Mariniplasma sp. M4Ah]
MALRRIGDILLDAKVITENQLNEALEKKEPTELLGETLSRLEYATEMQILKALEDSTGVKRVALSNFTIDEQVLAMVSEEFCRRHHIIPLRIEEKNLMYATSNPLDFVVNEELRVLTGYRPKAFSAPKNEIITQIEKYYGFTRTLEALGAKQSISKEEEFKEELDEETPMVKLVNQILTSAVFQRASDIHIDPLDDKVLIRYRVDGILDIVKEFPIKIHNQMISRIKVMSGMDITETRIPQDGRIQTLIQQKNIDLRISTLPTVRGEKIVMRILDLSGTMNRLSAIGFDSKEERLIRQMIEQPNGIVLVSGPTGSGKTTTLYACLQELNKPDVNIVTVEDPVEIKMAGVNQVQVHPEVNLTFAQALRSILRQDPNIVMVGEIRDVETAEIAIRASLTGHLVLSTIHTNNAIKTVTRLLDMEIEPFLIASSLSGIISQRLVRCLCTECSYDDEPTPSEVVMFKKFGMDLETVKRAKGCPSCNYKGYAGRTGIFEVLPITKNMQKLIAENAGISELTKLARSEGMKSIMESGMKKVRSGVTSLEEVLKVANEME